MKPLLIVTALQFLLIVGTPWISASAAERVIRLRTDLETEYSQSLDATNIRHLETVQCILSQINWDHFARVITKAVPTLSKRPAAT